MTTHTSPIEASKPCKPKANHEVESIGSPRASKLSAHLKDSELIQALREDMQDEPSSNMSQYITKLLKAQLALGE